VFRDRGRGTGGRAHTAHAHAPLHRARAFAPRTRLCTTLVPLHLFAFTRCLHQDLRGFIRPRRELIAGFALPFVLLLSVGSWRGTEGVGGGGGNRLTARQAGLKRHGLTHTHTRTGLDIISNLKTRPDRA
jgi:hypothetical protein